jgi:hypothetical protein
VAVVIGASFLLFKKIRVSVSGFFTGATMKTKNASKDAKDRERKAVKQDGAKAYERKPFQLMR